MSLSLKSFASDEQALTTLSLKTSYNRCQITIKVTPDFLQFRGKVTSSPDLVVSEKDFLKEQSNLHLIMMIFFVAIR